MSGNITMCAEAPTAAMQVATASRHRRWVMLAIFLSSFMVALEATIISTAMPSIISAIGGSSLMTWAFAAYLIVQVPAGALFGALADIRGRRTVFLLSASIFLMGSILCGFSSSMTELIIARTIQGAGGAGLLTVTTALIGDITTIKERPKFYGYTSAIWGVAALAGPLLGGLIVRSFGWPIVFWINVPICALAIVLVMVKLPTASIDGPPQPLGFISPFLLCVGAVALMIGLVQMGNLDTTTLALSLGTGAAALGLLGRREYVSAHPIVPVHLWQNPAVYLASAYAFFCGAILISLTAFLPTYGAAVLGLLPVEAALPVGTITLTWTIAVMIAGRLPAKLRDHGLNIGAGIITVVGCAIVLLGIKSGNYAWLHVGSGLLGIGLGTSSLLFNLQLQAGVDASDRGRATALYLTSRTLGQALGAAILGGVLNLSFRTDLRGGNDLLQILVEPSARAALPAATLQQLRDQVDTGSFNVFALTAVFAVVAFAIVNTSRLATAEAGRKRGPD